MRSLYVCPSVTGWLVHEFVGLPPTHAFALRRQIRPVGRRTRLPVTLMRLVSMTIRTSAEGSAFTRTFSVTSVSSVGARRVSRYELRTFGIFIDVVPEIGFVVSRTTVPRTLSPPVAPGPGTLVSDPSSKVRLR